MKKEKFNNITSLSSLATVSGRRKKKEILREQILRSYGSATIWDRRGKKVIDDGRVVDEEWLEKKLAKMRGRGKRKNVDWNWSA